MTKAELFEMIDYNTTTLSDNRAIKTAVEKWLSASNDGKLIVSCSLPPLDDETAAEPIQNALYATGKFSTDDCSTLADGILQYIKDAKMSIVGGNDR